MLYDVCVVGAGMFGSAAARHVSMNPSLKVALIGPAEPKDDQERQKREIFSSHYDEGRVTHVLDEQLVCQKLGEESIKRYREIEMLSGIQFYKPVGLLIFGQKGSKVMEDLRQAISYGKAPTLELESANLVKDRYSYLKINDDDVSYLDDNGAGYISPRKLTAAQQKIAVMQGCKIIRDVVKEVAPLKEKDGCYCHEIIMENEPSVYAKRVIVCTGAFTNLKRLIPNEEGNVPDIQMIPDTAAMVRVPEEEAQRLRSMPTMIYWGSNRSVIHNQGAYMIPPIKYPDGYYYIKVGSLDRQPELKTVEEVRDWYLSEGNQEVIDTRCKVLMDLFPDLKVDKIKGLACLISVSPSALPYIDRVSSNITVALAGNGKAARFSDEIGRIAAELAVYGRWDTDIPRPLLKIKWKKT